MVLLCIDNNSNNSEIFCDAVEMVNSTYTCLVANNDRQVVNILKNIYPDYIFLDINMPSWNGGETLQSIRKNKKLDFIPIIILSASLTPPLIKELYEKGADACLVKPNAPNKVMLSDSLRNIFHNLKSGGTKLEKNTAYK